MNALVVKTTTIKRMGVIAHRTDNAVVGAIKAMMIAQLKEQMANGVVHFIFLKNDGTLREAWGTTKRELANKHTNGRGVSRENYANTAYFDVEKGDWRSFRWENLIEVK